MKQVTNEIKEWCDQRGVLYVKFGMSAQGWPSTLIVFPGGFHLWVGVNDKPEKTGSMRKFRMTQLATMGALAVEFESVADALDYMQDCLDSAIVAMTPVPEPVKKKPTIVLPFNSEDMKK